jgi:hypothetical protein
MPLREEHAATMEKMDLALRPWTFRLSTTAAPCCLIRRWGGKLGWAAESACACMPAYWTLGRRRREKQLRRAGYVRAARPYSPALQIRAFVRYHLLTAPRSQGQGRDGGHGHLLLWPWWTRSIWTGDDVDLIGSDDGDASFGWWLFVFFS